MTDFEEKLAGFYWKLFKNLMKSGFNRSEALKICLKEARIPREKEMPEKVDVEKLLKELEKGKKIEE